MRSLFHLDRDFGDALGEYAPDEQSRRTYLSILRNILVMVGLLALATAFSLIIRRYGFHEANFTMTYILAVLVISNRTDSHIYGVISSLLGVLTFNYFFTEPRYTFMAYSPDYPVTFVIMLVVALITSTITAQAKNEARRVILRERRIQMLYQIERHLISTRTLQQVVEVVANDLAFLFSASILACVDDPSGGSAIECRQGEDAFAAPLELAARVEVFRSGVAGGHGTTLFPRAEAYYLPLIGQSGVHGVIGVSLAGGYSLSESQRVFLDTVAAQVALVIEREKLYESQQQTKLKAERERLRGDLLRAISHDLRTPLTGIIGSASTMLGNFDTIDDQLKRQFVQDIYEDAEWLSNLVENILSMTSFDDGRVKVKKEMEAVEELVASAVARVRQRAGQRVLRVGIPAELVLVPVDGLLIQQVLVNLLDNAIKHTPDQSQIEVLVTVEADRVRFAVNDHGIGIPNENLAHVFERFFTGEGGLATGRHGIGLGLTICRSIVEAHGGEIEATNNADGGASLQFTIPLEG